MKGNGKTTLADVVASIKELGEQLNVRIDSLESGLNARIDSLDLRVNTRLDDVLKLLGGYHRDHERRIAALEKKRAG